MATRGLVADQVEAGATSLAGLRDLVRRLSIRSDHEYASGAIASVHVVYSRYRSVSEQAPTVERILPLDPSVVRSVDAPSNFHRYLAEPPLVAGLVSQFAVVSLYHAAAESYASEQASRLLSMDAATRSTNRMVDDLTGIERRERQHEITRQMLELTASRIAGGRS